MVDCVEKILFYIENYHINVFNNGFNNRRRWEEIGAMPYFWSLIVPLHDDVTFLYLSCQAAKAQLD